VSSSFRKYIIKDLLHKAKGIVPKGKDTFTKQLLAFLLDPVDYTPNRRYNGVLEDGK
jgi:hypothetical protein